MDPTELEKVVEQLQKKDKVEEPDERSHKSRVAVIVLVMFITAAIFFSMVFASKLSKVGKDNVNRNVGNNEQDIPSVFFKPPELADNAGSYSGKVVYAKKSGGSNIKHQLVDADGNLLVYLDSSKHDLDLSLGMVVTLEGSPTNDFIDGHQVVDVEKIIFK